MCALCRLTNVPVCSVSGSCGLNIQQVLAVAVISGGAALALTLLRHWVAVKFKTLFKTINTFFKNRN